MLSSLVSGWERRLAAQLAAANGDAAIRAAWQQYADAASGQLAVVEPLYQAGNVGGEAEKYELLRLCAAKAAAALAKLAEGDAAELTAVTTGVATGQALVASTRAAWEAEAVTVDEMVDAIQRLAAARQKLAQLRSAPADGRRWQHDQAQALFDLAAKLRALRMVLDGPPDPSQASYVACQYLIVRSRMLNKKTP